MELKEALEMLAAAGVTGTARATWHPEGKLASLEVTFAPGPTNAAPFVDKDGRPIDLGEDLPDLAYDPIAKANADRAKAV